MVTLVDEPPRPRISGGSLALDPGHPKWDPLNTELLSLLRQIISFSLPSHFSPFPFFLITHRKLYFTRHRTRSSI